jgi:hypothetical protein
MTAVVVIAVILALIVGHHGGHAHANYRHGRAHGKRGVNLYWSSARGPYVSVPGPFHTRDGRKI